MKTFLTLTIVVLLYILMGMGFALWMHVHEPPFDVPLDEVQSETLFIILAWPYVAYRYFQTGSWHE